MNKEQKTAWLFLLLMGVLLATELIATKYLLEGDTATLIRRMALLVFLAISAFVISRKSGSDKVVKDERSEMISYRASWFGFMGAFIVLLFYGFLTIVVYEKRGAPAIPFETLESILSRQAILAMVAMGTIRSVTILISYRERVSD